MENFLAVSTANEYGQASGGSDIAGIWEVADLDDDALACFEGDGANGGKLVSGAAPSLSCNTVQFAVNRATDGVILSPLVDRETLVWEKQAAGSAVAKIMYVGAHDNSTGNLNAVTGSAGVWTLFIEDKSKEHYDTSRKHILTGAFTASDTDQTIVDLIIAAWNADSWCAALATASQGGDAASHYGLKLTGATAGVDFTVYAGDDISTATIYEQGQLNHAYTGSTYSSTAAAVSAIGDYTSLREEEKAGEARKGVNQEGEAKDKFGAPTSMLNSAYTYTTYKLRWKSTSADPNINRENKQYQELIIAVYTSGASTITAMDNILAAL